MRLICVTCWVGYREKVLTPLASAQGWKFLPCFIPLVVMLCLGLAIAALLAPVTYDA